MLNRRQEGGSSSRELSACRREFSFPNRKRAPAGGETAFFIAQTVLPPGRRHSLCPAPFFRRETLSRPAAWEQAHGRAGTALRSWARLA